MIEDGGGIDKPLYVSMCDAARFGNPTIFKLCYDVTDLYLRSINNSSAHLSGKALQDKLILLHAPEKAPKHASQFLFKLYDGYAAHVLDPHALPLDNFKVDLSRRFLTSKWFAGSLGKRLTEALGRLSEDSGHYLKLIRYMEEKGIPADQQVVDTVARRLPNDDLVRDLILYYRESFLDPDFGETRSPEMAQLTL